MNALALRYECLAFDALTPRTLYALLKLRSDIFVVEQNCVFSDMDDYDQGALHLVAWTGDAVVGAARLLPPGYKYPQASIGRVVIHPDTRGQQAGRQLMWVAMAECTTRYPGHPILLWAQQRLQAFYESLGFVVEGEPEYEDGILHVRMLRAA